MKRKTMEIEEIIELINQNSFEKQRKEHNTGNFDINKRKKRNKRRTDAENGTI